MLLWILKSIFVNLATLIAYIFNPIIVLFCDEKGKLPSWLMWAQCEDNLSNDIRWMVYEHCVPKFAEYDYDKHYIYHYEEKGDVEIKAGYVDLIDPNFTLKERFQRYICRCCWLYRNPVGTLCANLDAFYNGDVIIVVKDRQEFENDFFVSYHKMDENKILHWIKWFLYGKFCVWTYVRWCPWFCIRTYLGWKAKYIRPDGKEHRSSIAVYWSPFRQSD